MTINSPSYISIWWVWWAFLQSWPTLYCSITSWTMTQTDINNEYKRFLALQPVQPQKTNFIKEANRNVINNDLNVLWSNNVYIPSNDNFNFWTWSFSIAWTENYPLTFLWATCSIFSKDTVWAWRHFDISNYAVNWFLYVERGVAWVIIDLRIKISNWPHKFLFVRDAITSNAKLYIDWSLIQSSPTYTFPNLNSASVFGINSWLWVAQHKNWYTRDVKVRKWQAITPSTINTKTWLVLDLPMNEWTWLTCYDRSWATIPNLRTVTLWSAVTIENDAIAWKTKSMLFSDTANSYASNSAHTLVSPTNCMTVHVPIKCWPNATATQTIYRHWAQSNTVWFLWLFRRNTAFPPLDFGIIWWDSKWIVSLLHILHFIFFSFSNIVKKLIRQRNYFIYFITFDKK